MISLIKDEKLLEKYSETWKKSLQHYQKWIFHQTCIKRTISKLPKNQNKSL